MARSAAARAPRAASSSKMAVALAATALVLCAAASASAAAPVLKPERSANGVTRYTLNVTVGARDADCAGGRAVVLVNGLFQPTIEVAKGDRLEVLVINSIPESWPDVTARGGIAVHWHGLRQQGNPYADGAAWVSHCPIARGGRHLYNFTVDDPEGLYFWHDHSAFNRADGLQGMLVVRPPGTRVPAAAPRERLMMLQDWWHYQAGSMGVRLNRPFDPTKATNATGQWCWFGLPQSLLVNGRGVYPDCENVYTRAENKTMANGAPATAADLMSPTPCVAGQLGPKAAWPVCSPGGGAGGGAGDNGGKKGAARCAREEFEVAPGEAATFRIVNAAQLVYMTVCFQGHKLTLTAADGRAVAPLALGECVDVNAGQRVDVRVEAAPAPAAAGAAGAAARGGGAHWISVHGQYRKGSPSAYAVLRYKGAPRSAAPAAGAAMQPEEAWKRRWDINQTLAVKQAPRQGGGASDVPQKVDRRFIIHTTQPIMEANGLVRWALQNVAHANTPGCKALAPELHARPALLAAAAVKMTAKSGDAAYWPNTSLTGDGMGMRVVEATGPDADALLNAATPKAGLHAMTLRLGEVVEVVLQNNRAGAYGGEYNTTSPLTSARNGCEQHPFHRHGGHFFVVGMGLGQWSPDNVTTYNLVDPPARDTATLMFDADGPSGGWTAIRFKADNPGVWPLHCHILPHQHMGHAIDVIVEPDRALAPPKDLPQCPKACSYQFARFTTPLTEKVFGSAKLLAPAAANGGMGMGLGGMRRLLSQLLRRAAGAALL